MGTKKILVRAGEEPIDGALVPRSNAPNEAIVSTIQTLDAELLARRPEEVEIVSLPRPSFEGDNSHGNARGDRGHENEAGGTLRSSEHR